MRSYLNTINMFIEEPLYRTIIQTMPIPTVDILFFNTKGQILLGKRINEPLAGVYYIPGGRIHRWETLLDAAKRKAKEELSVDINVQKLKLVGIYDDFFHNSAFLDGTHCIPVTYVYQMTELEEQSISIWDTQHSRIQFFDLDDPTIHHMVTLRIHDVRKLDSLKT